MAKRSRAREVVLQLLYQHDHNPSMPEAAVKQFLSDRLRNPELEKFAAGVYYGSFEHRREIDERLTDVAENWSVVRMAAVDRNILRLAAYELLFVPDVPLRVVIDEAVELAKRFGSAESSAFVNGILDRVAALREGAESKRSSKT